MAKDPMSSFEIPSEMRNLAEQSVEQARKAFDVYTSRPSKPWRGRPAILLLI